MSAVRVISTTAFSLLLLAPVLQAKDWSIQESRYVTQQVGPTLAQADLMKSVIRVSIPERVLSVGAAIQYLLKPYGYQLDDEMGPPESLAAYVLLTRPLPEPHRTLNTMTLHDALEVLGGDSFDVLINPVLRTVGYRLKPGLQEHVSEADWDEAKATWIAGADASLGAAPITLPPKAEKGFIETPDYGPVKPGDTLGGIVLGLGLKGLTMAQALVHTFQSNPGAFANNNMNHLLVGVYLTVPPWRDELLPPSAASRVVDEHFRLWLQQVQP